LTFTVRACSFCAALQSATGLVVAYFRVCPGGKKRSIVRIVTGTNTVSCDDDDDDDDDDLVKVTK